VRRGGIDPTLMFAGIVGIPFDISAPSGAPAT